MRTLLNSVFNCDNYRGIKLITRLHGGLSHLHEHKIKHSFHKTLNPICSCGFDVESTSHYSRSAVPCTMMKGIPF